MGITFQRNSTRSAGWSDGGPPFPSTNPSASGRVADPRHPDPAAVIMGRTDAILDLPVEIGVWSPGAARPAIHVLRLDGTGPGRLEVRLDGAPERVEVDPGVNLLAEWAFAAR